MNLSSFSELVCVRSYQVQSYYIRINMIHSLLVSNSFCFFFNPFLPHVLFFFFLRIRPPPSSPLFPYPPLSRSSRPGCFALLIRKNRMRWHPANKRFSPPATPQASRKRSGSRMDRHPPA